ncbi:MAG: N-acetyltransferase [Verrucomicrobiales bacterium]|nr:N-acetyltransferase [Verrucomicrobiales bacterium]
MEFRIRAAQLDDLTAIVAIYNAAIPGRLATADTVPVSVESRRAWFDSHDDSRYPIRVLETAEGGVLGWVSLRPFYGRPAYASTAEISVYIATGHHGQGHARRLVEDIRLDCERLGLKNLVAFVFGHNQPSLRLFARAGFERWGHLPGIADLDGEERDLVILGRRVGASSEAVG